jgi:hypothetical protein
VDLVYVYKRTGDGRELRFSLRSAARNLAFENAHIVGDPPAWRCYANLIGFRGPQGKHENGFSKLKHAVESREVSDPFVLMNDDFFILKPFASIPYYYQKRLVEWIETFPHRSSYYQRAIKTLGIVGQKANIFEVHFPIVYEKDRLRFLIKKYELPCGIMLRTLYCSTFKIKGEQSKDFKARNSSEVRQFSEGAFMSTSEQAAHTQAFSSVMKQRFPDASPFE